MNNAWSIEYSRILVALGSAALFGLVSEQWLLSVILHAGIYIGWNLYQLKIFEQWIRKGAPVKSAPDSSGVWSLIVQHFYRSQTSNKNRKKHLTTIANHYHAVMSALPDATIILNDKLEIEWANKPSHDILGIDVVRDIGHPIDNIIRDLGLQTLLSSDDESIIELLSPLDNLKTLSFAKLRYTEDKTLLIVRDVSQRIAIQKLRKAFVANASHELRTPLTVISGYLEILDTDEELPPAVNKVINNALGQAQRMEKILNNLLVLSKLEEKGISKHQGDIIQVPDLISRLVTEFDSSSTSTRHKFELKVDSTLKLTGIEQDFYSLCQNLVSNAVKYSPEDSTIKICWTKNANDFACFSVTDSGEGIAKKYLLRLTERFFRVNVDRERKVQGTGLGLSIVKHILDNNGGFLDITSQLGKGSTFSACFPSSTISSIDTSNS
ncbi:MAG: two-component system phosphate regulon sensor histidine kinase PhoR [Enterobacterales bacterium]|jgi:two-component system phosphate regulon sensor histidine kinase PhoR